MQTILGAGGGIGISLAKALQKYTKDIRLVSRNPKKANDKDQLFAADLTKIYEVDKAVEGSEIVYLVAGLTYNIKVWRKQWPLIMRNVIESCKKHKSKLVFFDNVYVYDRDSIDHMTENTPVRPTSKKGKVREEIQNMLMREIQNNNINALITRAPDFMDSKNGLLTLFVINNLKKGKKATWLANADKIHNLIYTDDAAKATALLGNAPGVYNQVWHLPSIKERLTGKQWIELVAKKMNVQPRYSVIPIWMLRLSGIFIPIMKEIAEMTYQYDHDYYFDGSKFEKHFKYSPVSAEEGVELILASL